MKSKIKRSIVFNRIASLNASRWNVGKETGSTLIEAVVTMALVAILAAVVTLRINIRTSRVDGAAALLETHLLEVKKMAMSSRQIVGLRFNSERLNYEGVAVASEASPSSEWKQDNPFSNQELHVEMDIESLITDIPGDIVCFDRLGRPTNLQGTLLTKRHSIELQSDGKIQRLSIEPITGWIRR